MRPRPLVLVAILIAAPASAASARPVVLELFTSQGCSSCPPADALLAELARTRGDVLALDFHVTYWNGLGWADPFSLAAATARQDWYAARFGAAEIYTPELVVDGTVGVVGSDRPAVLAAIDAASGAIAERGASGIPALHVARLTDGLAIVVDGGHGRGRLLVVGYDPEHETAVGGGENGGRRLREVDVVRSLADAARWDGGALTVHAPLPAGQRAAVLIQGEDGRVLAAATVP